MNLSAFARTLLFTFEILTTQFHFDLHRARTYHDSHGNDNILYAAKLIDE